MMDVNTNIRMCHDVLPDPFYAADLALDENPANAPDGSLLPDLQNFLGDERAAAVFLTGKKWGRDKIRVAYFNEPLASQRLRFAIRDFANEWADYSGLEMEWLGYDTDSADIRITFTRGGSWSYLGTDALSISQHQPTMQFGWLTPDDVLSDAGKREIGRVARHEFGHAYGLGHEHAHPEGGIPWDKPKVYDYYAQTQGWSRSDVDNQVFKVYDRNIVATTKELDVNSIMLYPIDNALTIGDFETHRNFVLSEKDRRFIGRMYEQTTGQMIRGRVRAAFR